MRAPVRTASAARLVVTVACAAIFLAPLVFVVIGALHPAGRPPPAGLSIPWPPAWSNVSRAARLVPIARMAFNSTVVADLSAIVGMVSCSWAGFAIARARPRVRRVLVGAVFAGLMVPAFALWIPRFLVFRRLGFADGYVPLIAPALIGVSPFNLLLCIWAMRRVEPELFEAAELEGSGSFRTWWRVALPLTRSTTVTVGVLIFAAAWGSLIDPLLYLTSPGKFTLPMGLRALQELDRTDWPVMLSGALVSMLPPVAAFVVVQRWLLGSPRR